MARESLLGRKYGELLKSIGICTDEEVNVALAEQEKTNEDLDTILIRNGITTEDHLLKSLSEALHIESILFDVKCNFPFVSNNLSCRSAL